MGYNESQTTFFAASEIGKAPNSPQMTIVNSEQKTKWILRYVYTLW